MRRPTVTLAFVVAASGLAGQDGPPRTELIRGPYLQSLLPTSVEIIWVTAGLEESGAVRLHPGGEEEVRVEEDPSLACASHREAALCHRVRLAGLSPETAYRYEVLAGETELTAGLDLLKAMSKVRVLSIKEGKKDPHPATDLTHFLAWHGIAATVGEAPVDAHKATAEHFLAAAAEAKATLIVMGAYSHGRLRQLVLGGVTSHMIDAANLPVLMAH